MRMTARKDGQPIQQASEQSGAFLLPGETNEIVPEVSERPRLVGTGRNFRIPVPLASNRLRCRSVLKEAPL